MYTLHVCNNNRDRISTGLMKDLIVLWSIGPLFVCFLPACMTSVVPPFPFNLMTVSSSLSCDSTTGVHCKQKMAANDQGCDTQRCSVNT